MGGEATNSDLNTQVVRKKKRVFGGVSSSAEVTDLPREDDIKRTDIKSTEKISCL